MNPRFIFHIYVPRVQNYDDYRLNIHKDGWTVKHIAIGGDCDKRGYPYLFENLEQDSVEYPSGLGFQMELLFEHARDKSLPDKEIQRRLDALAKWVEDVNAVPRPQFD
jgi:hypothetical protein